MNKRIFLIDTSGSMYIYKDVIEQLIGTNCENTIILTTHCEEKLTFDVLSDVGESGDYELNFWGGTNLGLSLEVAYRLLNKDEVLFLITDDVTQDDDRYDAMSTILKEKLYVIRLSDR